MLIMWWGLKKELALLEGEKLFYPEQFKPLVILHMMSGNHMSAKLTILSSLQSDLERAASDLAHE
jgi:hypothetical protein